MTAFAFLCPETESLCVFDDQTKQRPSNFLYTKNTVFRQVIFGKEKVVLGIEKGGAVQNRALVCEMSTTKGPAPNWLVQAPDFGISLAHRQ